MLLLALIALLLADGDSYPGETEQTQSIAKTRGWTAEVRMPDGSRADLISDEWAAEVEWAGKWKEAPAQAVLYSVWTDRRPLVIILTTDERADKVHLLRCRLVCERLGIQMEVYKAAKEIGQ